MWSSRSSDSARWAPRRDSSKAWISSTMTICAVRSISRERSAVSSRYSDSGVVTRISGGLRTSWRPTLLRMATRALRAPPVYRGVPSGWLSWSPSTPSTQPCSQCVLCAQLAASTLGQNTTRRPWVTAVARCDEIGLRRLQFVARDERVQRGRGDAEQNADDRQHHELFDQADAALATGSLLIRLPGHAARPALPETLMLSAGNGGAQRRRQRGSVGVPGRLLWALVRWKCSCTPTSVADD